jgi:hypothetical protein
MKRARPLESKKNKQATNAELVKFYFTQDEKVDGSWHCTCGKTRKQLPNTGTSNLINHIKTEHKNFEEEVKLASHQKDIGSFFSPSEKAKNIYGWLDWIISEGYFLK